MSTEIIIFIVVVGALILLAVVLSKPNGVRKIWFDFFGAKGGAESHQSSNEVEGKRQSATKTAPSDIVHPHSNIEALQEVTGNSVSLDSQLRVKQKDGAKISAIQRTSDDSTSENNTLIIE